MIDLTDRLRSKLVGSAGRGRSRKHDELERERKIIAKEFCAEFYAIRYPDVTGDTLDHFIKYGWREELDPAPWFSTSFYLQTYQDVRAAGLNPFYHYIEHGRTEGRIVAPAAHLQNDRAWEVEAIRRGLKEDFYSAQLRDVGVDPADLDLALHYWREGAGLGLDPAPEFSTTHYLSQHADVVAAGVNPFAHYLQEGRKEGRTARPTVAPDVDTPRTASRESPRRKTMDHDRKLAESAFDEAYYLAANADVAAAGVDPLNHFLSSGWREGRNPTLWFSVSNYLDLYPDVAGAGINPFLHYLMAGKAEGRLPRHDLGFRYDIITGLQTLDARIQHARTSSPRRTVSNPRLLRDALDGVKRLERKGLYISISHDDFTENFGGVQLVLMRESAAVDQMGYDHLHLFPATPLPIADLETTDPILGVLLNRERVGYFRASEIQGEVARIKPRLTARPFVIHSLIGHSAEALIAILKAAGCSSGWYWVHDYSSVCPGYTLLRNDVEFCGGPSPSSTACSMCVYGSFRPKQIAAHERLFNDLELTVLAPSEAALDVWKLSVSVLAPAKVHEHLQIRTSPKKVAARTESPSARPLRVAYVGQPVIHKGWPVFRDLVVRFANDPRYEFFHVGKNAQGIPAKFKEVAVGAGDLDEMVRALSELEIDIALLWSLWPETFCIAAVEALRAGAAIITFKDSGNVAAMVKQTGFGSVLNSEEELTALFESGDAAKLAAQTRPAGLTAEFSNMTSDFVQENAA